MPISKPFVIATEGATTDGRVITREWIDQMAESYDPKSFTALGNLEHYISALPDSVFSAYGKVLKLSTQMGEVLGQKKKQLLAVFDASDSLVALQKAGKKMFCSMEVNPDFAKTGKAYLQSLAFTDNPASLGTEVMQFAAQAKTNPFESRKKESGNLFSAAEEVTLEWEEEPAKPTAGDTLFAKIKDLLKIGQKDADARFADQANAIETVAESQKTLIEGFARIEQEMAALGATVKLNVDAIAVRKSEIEQLTATLQKTPDGTGQRPPATGGDGRITTDC